MKKLKINKGLIIYTIALTLLVLGTPLIAGVLTSFNPGETISSSAVNDNFSTLQSRVDNICEQPGQIAVTARVQADGDLLGSPFTCNGGAVNIFKGLAGIYEITVDGLESQDFFLAITPIFNPQSDVFCSVNDPQTTPNVVTVFCRQLVTGVLLDNSFLITWIRRP